MDGLTRRSFLSALSAAVAGAGVVKASCPKPLAAPVDLDFQVFGVDWEPEIFISRGTEDSVAMCIFNLPLARSGKVFAPGVRGEIAHPVRDYFEALDLAVDFAARGRKAEFFPAPLPQGVDHAEYLSWGRLPVIRQVALYDVVFDRWVVRNDVHVRFS
jgi:hypothetical protein